jgi:hypothetical protein
MRKVCFLLLVGLLTIWGTAMAKDHRSHPAPKETICDGEQGDAHDLCQAFCMDMHCEGDNHQGDDQHGDDRYGGRKSTKDDHHGDSGGDHHGDGGDDHHGESDCERTQHEFEQETGRPLPCMISCPCGDQFPLFASLAHGTVTVVNCISNTQTISIGTPQGTFAVVNNGAMPPFCDVNGVAPFLTLTAAEATACRALLNQAATAQNVVCVAPE